MNTREIASIAALTIFALASSAQTPKPETFLSTSLPSFRDTFSITQPTYGKLIVNEWLTAFSAENGKKIDGKGAQDITICSRDFDTLLMQSKREPVVIKVDGTWIITFK